jgi:Protein of unknown function (DUF1552)
MSSAQSRRGAATRRAFLGGGAVVVGLPFLESLQPRAARGAAADTPKRLIYYWVPNGLNMAGFRPATTGPGYATPPMLVPLESLKSDFMVVTGLENMLGKPDGAGDHAAGTSAFITCAHALKSETDISLGISADQVAAAQIGKLTRLPSLQLGIDGGSSAGGCDSGYSCAYARNISWSGPTTPLPKMTSPQQIFDQIFAGFDPMASQADVMKRKAYSQSVLDSVTRDATGLSGKLGAIDRGKLDQYMTGVRELERRITDTSGVACTPGTRPAKTLEYPAQVQVTSDLMVLALQCDATRIITFMLGNAVSGRTYPFLNITRGHHDISHHGGNATNIDELQKIGTWEMEQLAYLMTKMKAITEADGSNMLFNSTIFLSSDVSDGDRHNHDDLPVILGGHGGGVFTPGKHVAYAKATHTKVSSLLVNMLATVGVQNGKLGDSPGPLTDL